MKRHLTSAALLGLLVIGGCADRGENNTQNLDENKAPAAAEPASPRAESPRAEAPPADATDPHAAAPRRDASQGARATTGTRSTRATSRSAATEPPDSGTRSPDRALTPRPEEPPRSESAASPAPARRSVEWREVTIPAGTALPLELETALSSETAQVETPVRARLKQSVVVDGVQALPAGAIVTGNVTSVDRAGRVKGRASLAFTFNQVRADNISAGIRTAPLSYVGEASKGEDATKIGAGAVGGAIVGGIVGGKEGAAKGAAIGGAAGSGVVLATRGKEVELASGADLAATLAAPLTIRVAAR